VWVGWFRTSETGPWQRACEADELCACHRDLLRHTPATAPSGNRFITSSAPPFEGSPAIPPARCA
jgi:hypothetical protein